MGLSTLVFERTEFSAGAVSGGDGAACCSLEGLLRIWFSLGLQEEERQALTLSLELEQQRGRALQEERDEARAGQLSERRQLEALKLALEEERQAWAQRELELQERYGALQEEVLAQLEKEKVRAAVPSSGNGQQLKGRMTE